MRVVFMGTPEFAVRSLREIVENSQHQVVGVVTVPDRPAGRGQKMVSSPVKEYALEKDIALAQPEKLRDEGFHDILKSWNADVFVVVAFRMLPRAVWSIPRFGTFNLHASLLPQYRGAAPINWAVINGESKTGVTTFLIDDKIDTGNILLQKKESISEDDSAGSLHDRLMETGASLVVETLDGLETGRIVPIEQEEPSESKPAPKIYKEDTYIDLNDKGSTIYNKIRGLSPYPGAILTMDIDGQRVDLKVFRSSFLNQELDVPFGESIIDNGRWLISLHNGALELLELQWPGKKRMDVNSFLRGFRYKNTPKWLP